MRSPDYESLRLLARKKREEFGLTTETIGLATINQIYRAERIAVDRWKLSPRLRAVYMCDDNDPSVLVNKRLPEEPRLFALIHELKHHYEDRNILLAGQIPCGDYNANREIEIGAEVFAAEFIFPQAECLQLLASLGLKPGHVTEEHVVRLKKATSARVSYTFLRKRLEYLRFVSKGQFNRTKFTLVEERMFGVPIYKKTWFKALRASRSARLRAS